MISSCSRSLQRKRVHAIALLLGSFPLAFTDVAEYLTASHTWLAM